MKNLYEDIANKAANIIGFNQNDIIFDPNIFPVATGMEEDRKSVV
jgi:5-methyltetrahydrofolate--homocysteine methyltransferase